MYEKLKRAIKKVIPLWFLIQNEEILRNIYFQFYRGHNRKCNLCEKTIRKFIATGNGEKMCPNCGSTGRNRRLWNILKPEINKENRRILHFSPSRSLYRILKKQPQIKYESTDYSGEFIADKRIDITKTDEPDELYDLIICYHVLEHVEEDIKAMKELYRILKKEGKCIIQTPFKEGEIFEDLTLSTSQERKKQFGQEDHVRIYSVNGLKLRLQSVGFEVDVRRFSENRDNYFGLNEGEYVLFAMK